MGILGSLASLAVPGWAKPAAVAIGAAGLAAGGYLYGHHVESLVLAAYQAQVQAASARATADAEHHDQVLQDAADEQQAATVAQYQEKLREATTTQAAVSAADLAGSQRVFVPVTAACRSGALSGLAAGSGGPDGATAYTAQLLPGFALAVLDIGSSADATVARLTAQVAALQARVRQDLTEINGAYTEEGTDAPAAASGATAAP